MNARPHDLVTFNSNVNQESVSKLIDMLYRLLTHHHTDSFFRDQFICNPPMLTRVELLRAIKKVGKYDQVFEEILLNCVSQENAALLSASEHRFAFLRSMLEILIMEKNEEKTTPEGDLQNTMLYRYFKFCKEFRLISIQGHERSASFNLHLRAILEAWLKRGKFKLPELLLAEQINLEFHATQSRHPQSILTLLVNLRETAKTRLMAGGKKVIDEEELANLRLQYDEFIQKVLVRGVSLRLLLSHLDTLKKIDFSEGMFVSYFASRWKYDENTKNAIGSLSDNQLKALKEWLFHLALDGTNPIYLERLSYAYLRHETVFATILKIGTSTRELKETTRFTKFEHLMQKVDYPQGALFDMLFNPSEQLSPRFFEAYFRELKSNPTSLVALREQLLRSDTVDNVPALLCYIMTAPHLDFERNQFTAFLIQTQALNLNDARVNDCLTAAYKLGLHQYAKMNLVAFLEDNIRPYQDGIMRVQSENGNCLLFSLLKIGSHTHNQKVTQSFEKVRLLADPEYVAQHKWLRFSYHTVGHEPKLEDRKASRMKNV